MLNASNIIRVTCKHITVFACVFALVPAALFAHSGEGIDRYVAADGEDVGGCNNVARPCKTLGYAARKAIKGDKVLVAAGVYEVLDVADLFRVVNPQSPILGGYNRFDLYLSQNPKENASVLYGVPREYEKQLESQGFRLKTDIKFLFDSTRRRKISGMEKVVAELGERRSSIACVAGMASIHACENVDLLSHIPLAAFSSKPTSANDVWGFQSLNDGREYVLVGLRNGVAIVDVTDPLNPIEIDTVNGGSSYWRDMKVLQKYNDATGQWQAYAYITADDSQSVADNVKIIDLSLLPNSVSELSAMRSDAYAHNVYISNVEYSTAVAINNRSPLMHITGSSTSYGMRGYDLTNPVSPVLQLLAPAGKNAARDYIHDSSSMISAPGSCIENINGCEVFIDFNVDSVNLWNVENRAAPTLLSNFIPPTARYIHSGWASEDGRYLFVHDELDEYDGSVANTQIDVFDISNLSAPMFAGAWVGPSNVIDHNGYAKGNRYYVSHYESGLVILDISDARNPVRVGYFDTFPMGETSAFHGAWGVFPFLPSGIIAVADVNSGLYLLKNNTLNSASGSIELAETDAVVARGDTVILQVDRVAGSAGEVSVQYETIYASANSEDITLSSGTLNWIDGDATSQSIEVATIAGAQENNDTFLVRLYNVAGGAVLGVKNLAKVVLANGQLGVVGLQSDVISVVESAQTISIPVIRSSGAFGEISIQYQLVAGTAIAGEDYIESSGTITWSDYDVAAKIINITLMDDSVTETDESFVLQLNGDDALLGATKQLTISIHDNDSVGDGNTNTHSSRHGGGALGFGIFLLFILAGCRRLKNM